MGKIDQIFVYMIITVLGYWFCINLTHTNMVKNALLENKFKNMVSNQIYW